MTHAQLTQVLKHSVKPRGGPSNVGFDNNEWAVVVNRDGMVCAVTMSGQTAADQWLASRAIAAAGRGSGEAAPLATSIGDPQHGAMLSRAAGCDSCHVVPGINDATGLIGPPLMQMGVRACIAACLYTLR